jgi:rubrerythrin
MSVGMGRTEILKIGENMKNKEESIENVKKLMGYAIREKMETEEIYRELSRRIDSIFMKERLKFLAREEEEQREALEKLANQIFGETISVPEHSDLPLADIGNIENNPMMPLEDIINILEKAKIADKETMDMYASMSDFFEKDSPEKKMLDYLAYLEEEHYYLLERKIMKLEKFGVV